MIKMYKTVDLQIHAIDFNYFMINNLRVVDI
jgi:hypothetical protein